MRATGHSVCSSLARLGAFISPYFVISNASLFLVGTTLAVVNFIAAGVALLLPETKGMKLDHVGVGTLADPSEPLSLELPSSSSSNKSTVCTGTTSRHSSLAIDGGKSHNSSNSISSVLTGMSGGGCNTINYGNLITSNNSHLSLPDDDPYDDEEI